MNQLTPTAVCSFFGAALLAVISAGPESLRQLLAEVGRIPEYERQLDIERDRQRQLDGESREALSRLERKSLVIAELTARHLTLLEAAARFRDINVGKLAEVDALVLPFAPCSEEESLCRQVIAWIHSDGSLTHYQAEEVAQRFEAELSELLARRGSVTLPD